MLYSIAIPKMYNLTNLTHAENLYGFVRYVNDGTSGLFIILTLFAVFIVLLLGLKRYTFSSAFMVSSFFGLVLSLIFASITLLNWSYVLLFIALAAFSVFIDLVTN